MCYYWGHMRHTHSQLVAGVLCQFPFTFDNRTYTSCTQAANSSQAWCSTKVDQFSHHISGEQRPVW